jgi:hypothetical protein
LDQGNKLKKEPYHIYRHKRKKNDRATVELATAKANLLHDDYTKRRKRKNTNNREYSPRSNKVTIFINIKIAEILTEREKPIVYLLLIPPLDLLRKFNRGQ